MPKDAIPSPNRARAVFVLVQTLGGAAVLGSYAHGLLTHADAVEVLWGTTAPAVVDVYTKTMLAAAFGYFPFTILWLLHGPAMRLGDRPVMPVVSSLYALVLIPSALWMPLTFAAANSRSIVAYVAMRVALVMVAAGSLGLLVVLLRARERPSRALFVAAVLGMAAFFLQTAILDAFVWPSLVPIL